MSFTKFSRALNLWVCGVVFGRVDGTYSAVGGACFASLCDAFPHSVGGKSLCSSSIARLRAKHISRASSSILAPVVENWYERRGHVQMTKCHST